MVPLKILCIVLLAWPCLTTPLKAPAPPQRIPVYFPITPEEFEAYGIRLSPSAGGLSKSLRGDAEDLPSTTPKPTTTTMRLPIAQESHVAPKQIIVESPGALYLKDTNYYIPGRPTNSSRAGVDQQDISGNPRYEDDDRGNTFIEPAKSSRSRGNQRDEDDEEVGPRYSVIGPDTSPQDQERFGVFFIGEHESFGGSEEHFEEVPFGSLYIPPNSDEDFDSSLQTLPAARPSSLNYGSRVSVEEPDKPVYGAPRRPSSRYDSPEQSFVDQYAPPSTTSTTNAPYQPPSTTERSYEPPSTTEQSYLPPSSTVNYYTPPTTPARYYVLSSTTERSYLPPPTTEGRYRAPSKESSEEVPESITTPRYSQPRISLSTGYGPPVTPGNVYVQSRVTSAARRYTPTTTTTERPYSSPRRSNPTTTTTEAPYSPPRRSNHPTTTTERAYTSPRSSAPRRYTIPTTTTEKSYGAPKLVSVRRYTGPPPTTTTTTSSRPYTEIPPTKNRSRARARYTPPSTTTAAPTATAAPAGYRRPTPTSEEPSHAVYIKASSEVGKSRKATPSKQRTSYKSREKDESSRKTFSRQPAVIKSVYSAPNNLTIKSISVATSSSVSSSAPASTYSGARSQPSRLRSSSRASSTYKSPFTSEEKEQDRETKVLSLSGSRSSDSRAGSKYQFPVYRTSDKAFQAPSSLYQIRDSSKTTAISASQPDFVQAGDNIYIPQEYDESSIPGEAGVDYPILRAVPDTSFRCEAQEHPGLYADTEADCQVFHICQKAGRHDSFLCPNGTVFNQQYFVCDWWYNFACDSATSFFGLNEFIYELPEEDEYRRSK